MRDGVRVLLSRAHGSCRACNTHETAHEAQLAAVAAPRCSARRPAEAELCAEIWAEIAEEFLEAPACISCTPAALGPASGSGGAAYTSVQNLAVCRNSS